MLVVLSMLSILMISARQRIHARPPGETGEDHRVDARGAIGVTERAPFTGRVRGLAKGVAEAYLKEREALGFPLLKGAAAKGVAA